MNKEKVYFNLTIIANVVCYAEEQRISSLRLIEMPACRTAASFLSKTKKYFIWPVEGWQTDAFLNSKRKSKIIGRFRKEYFHQTTSLIRWMAAVIHKSTSVTKRKHSLVQPRFTLQQKSIYAETVYSIWWFPFSKEL